MGTRSIAREASVNGAPMARAMFVEFPQDSAAWARDEQYLLGPSILVAPPVAKRTDIWLPAGEWHDRWTEKRTNGGNSVPAPTSDDAAIYVRAGAVIPMGNFALSSEFIPKDRMEVHVWPGADGHFDLYEDDGKTEDYRSGAYSVTELRWDDRDRTLKIIPHTAPWTGAPTVRAWTVYLHGARADSRAVIDGGDSAASEWDGARNTLVVKLPRMAPTHGISLRFLTK